MKPSWLVMATLLGLGVYLVLELLFGPYGVIAFNQLERFRDRSALELNELHRQTADLQLQVRMLTTDAETIRLEARDIGLVGQNEVVLRLENRDPRPRHRYMPGTVPAEISPVRDNRPLFRSVGFTAFLLTLLVQLLGIKNLGTKNLGRKNQRSDRGAVKAGGDVPTGKTMTDTV